MSPNSRVGELEQENERLRTLVDGRPSPARASSEDSSTDSQELEQLRIQLAQAKEREAELMRRLEASTSQVKTEPCDPTMSDTASSAESSPTLGPTSLVGVPTAKSTASLGLMVRSSSSSSMMGHMLTQYHKALLCALPSILSKSSSDSGLPSQSILGDLQWDAPCFLPAPTGSAPALGCNFDWSEPSLESGAAQHAGVDIERQPSAAASDCVWKKLEFEGEDESQLESYGLGSLDISFNTEQAKDGKFRIRIHSSVAPAESKDERRSPTLIGSPVESLTVPLGLPSPASDASFPPYAFQSHESDIDVPVTDLHTNPFSAQYSQAEPLAQFFGMPSSPFDLSGCQGPVQASRRCIRIALKSLPQSGCEGGEWEVEMR